MTEIPKRYDPAAVEARWQKYWEDEGIYAFDPESDRPVYSIDTPPPTVSGSLHIGHVFSYTHTEIQARFWRMRGRNVYYPMGFDDNGLPSERLTEKELGIRSTDLPREEFVEKCHGVVRKYEKEFEDLWRRMGMSIDWSLTYTTIEERTRRISQRSFLDLLKKGRVYRRTEPVMWCPECRTAIAQAEVESRSLESSFNDVVFTLENGDPLVIATTRPELLPSCVAVFIHPEDAERAGLAGRKATAPVFDLQVPILLDPQVDREKGTGVVMCCTFGDRTDIEWWKTHGLDLRISITRDGKMNELAGEFQGRTIREAREAVLRKVEEKGLLRGRKKIRHDVNVHERCKTELEFLSTPQWFVRVMDMKGDLIRRAEEILWFPGFMKARYADWVENLAWDWCISRQRFFGVPFPVWYCRSCGEMTCAEEKDLPVDPLATGPASPCRCGGRDFEPDRDVMDTWATSSLTPHINARWGEKDERKIFPMGLRPQAHEIIRTWLFYTMVKSLLHNECVPWKNVAISGFITIPKEPEKKKDPKKGRGFKAEKISKSRHADLTSPFRLLRDHGADGLRDWASNAPLGSDMPLKTEDFALGKRVLTKIWNAFRLCAGALKDFAPAGDPDLEIMDLWMLSRVNGAIERATRCFEGYDFRAARLEIGDLFWKDFCDNYLEIVKDRLYNPGARGEPARRAAQHALYRAGLAILKMYAPFVPHVTEEIYQNLYRAREKARSIHLMQWPEPEPLPDKSAFARQAGNTMVEMLGVIRRYKAERNLSMKADVAAVVIKGHPEDHSLLAAALDDLKAVGSLRSVTFEAAEKKGEAVLSIPDSGFPDAPVSIAR